MAPSDRIRIRSVEVLSQDPYVLKKTTFDYRRRDGSWQTLTGLSRFQRRKAPRVSAGVNGALNYLAH